MPSQKLINITKDQTRPDNMMTNRGIYGFIIIICVNISLFMLKLHVETRARLHTRVGRSAEPRPGGRMAAKLVLITGEMLQDISTSVPQDRKHSV